MLLRDSPYCLPKFDQNILEISEPISCCQLLSIGSELPLSFKNGMLKYASQQLLDAGNQCIKMLRIINSTKPTPHATVEVTDQLRICSLVSLKPMRLLTTQK